MYSFVPLEAGSYWDVVGMCSFACVLVSLGMMFAVAGENDAYIKKVLIISNSIVITGFAILAIACPPKIPKNEQVTGEFVAYVAEGYSEQTGKQRTDKHKSYVVYRVPEGEVMLPIIIGMPYPKEAILYRN